ncbi:hypothetical protein M0657_005048 [Pyricularia oryzae]|uniref:GATA-type domain-containing protein n=2 Tax=Pyricularia oryzae TaxID=318829 RepID=A0AA97NXL7_PYRO3|nr:hypothetical protein OOU_Y34scaffold00552g126 [Pyricularia oryzae Y34]KAI7923583.1 hypothetical protein M0657_005048 [Pyricularia oryzae]
MAAAWLYSIEDKTSSAMLQLVVIAFAIWALQFIIPETKRHRQRKLLREWDILPNGSAKQDSLAPLKPKQHEHILTKSRSLQVLPPYGLYGRDTYTREDAIGNHFVQPKREAPKPRQEPIASPAPQYALMPAEKSLPSREPSCVSGHSSVALTPRNHAVVPSRQQPMPTMPAQQPILLAPKPRKKKSPARLSHMPSEFLQMVASYLSPLALMCFAVTCRAAYAASHDRFATIGSLDLLATEAFLLMWERELEGHVYCHGCMRLHAFHAQGKEVTLRRCARQTDDFRLGRYTLPYLVARLAVNRHLYGERCGVPLHVLRMCRRVDEPAPGVEDDGWAVMQTVQARVTSDGELVVASTWTLYKRIGVLPRPGGPIPIIKSRTKSITDGKFGFGTNGGLSRTTTIGRTQSTRPQSTATSRAQSTSRTTTTSRTQSTSRPQSIGRSQTTHTSWPQSFSRTPSFSRASTFSRTRKLMDKVSAIGTDEMHEDQVAASEYQVFERAVGRFSEHLAVCPSTHQWDAYRVMSGKVAEFADPRQLEPAYGAVRSCLKCLTDYEVNIIEGVAPDQFGRYHDKRHTVHVNGNGGINGIHIPDGDDVKRVPHTDWVLSMTKYCYLGGCRSPFEERWPSGTGNGLDGRRTPERGATVRDMWLRGDGRVGTVAKAAEVAGVVEARREQLRRSFR